MNRTRFYNEVEVNGIDEIDFLYNNLSKFSPKYRVAYFKVKEVDLQRPDLISDKVYGTVKYWWLILSFNGIQNPFTDIQIGDLLKMPNILDIYDFYKRYALR